MALMEGRKSRLSLLFRRLLSPQLPRSCLAFSVVHSCIPNHAALHWQAEHSKSAPASAGRRLQLPTSGLARQTLLARSERCGNLLDNKIPNILGQAASHAARGLPSETRTKSNVVKFRIRSPRSSPSVASSKVQKRITEPSVELASIQLPGLGTVPLPDPRRPKLSVAWHDSCGCGGQQIGSRNWLPEDGICVVAMVAPLSPPFPPPFSMNLAHGVASTAVIDNGEKGDVMHQDRCSLSMPALQRTMCGNAPTASVSCGVRKQSAVRSPQLDLTQQRMFHRLSGSPKAGPVPLL
ncbi:hypothetical protein VTK26DRAFT_7331 [Humicola hyalothermophila]